MNIYLRHHRCFSETLRRLSALDVGWDGHCGSPLKRKTLFSATEFFACRPDLTLGAHAELTLRGGLTVTLFRDGCDVTIQFCTEDSIHVSRLSPEKTPTLEIFFKKINADALGELAPEIPEETAPIIDFMASDDEVVGPEREGFCAVRLASKGEMLVGRRTCMRGVIAFHPVSDVPDEITREQRLSDGTFVANLAKREGSARAA